MSHGAMSGYFYQLEVEVIKKHAQTEYDKFINYTKDNEIDLLDFANCVAQSDEDYLNGGYETTDVSADVIMRCNDFYKLLIKSFKRATGCVIELIPVDNEDNGSPYDDVDAGAYWAIDAMMQRPEVTALGEGAVSHKSFVVYG